MHIKIKKLDVFVLYVCLRFIFTVLSFQIGTQSNPFVMCRQKVPIVHFTSLLVIINDNDFFNFCTLWGWRDS